jgi:hypothetical protein
MITKVKAKCPVRLTGDRIVVLILSAAPSGSMIGYRLFEAVYLTGAQGADVQLFRLAVWNKWVARSIAVFQALNSQFPFSFKFVL